MGIILTLMMLCPKLATGQNTLTEGCDFGAWKDVQVVGNFGKAYLVGRAEHRSNNTFKSTECWFMVACGGYRLTPWLSSDVSYEFWNIGGRAFHKAVLGASGTLREGGLSVTLREKYELCLSDGGYVGNTLRSRLRAQYSPQSGALKPYLMAEIFTWDTWQRSLYYVGTDIRLGGCCSLDLFYLLHLPNGARAVHTLGAGINFNF